MSRADNSVTNWRNLPISNPKQISLISMYVPILVKITWHLLQLSSENENMSRADNSVKIWRNLPISNPKSDLHNINAHTKLNPLMFTQVIIRKRNADGRTTDGRTDGQTDGRTDRHTDVQRETIMIIARHYRVAGYKKHTALIVVVLQTIVFIISIWTPKLLTILVLNLYKSILLPVNMTKMLEWMANNVERDVWSGPTLFDQTCLSESLG